MAVYADQRRWDDLAGIFAEHIDLDYTSLTGGEPGPVPRAGLIAGWRDQLGGLDATQHLIADFLVTTAGDEATVTAGFQATHLLDNPHGERLWVLGGDYRFGLSREAGAWRITALTMTARWATGNQHIMTLAADRARAAGGS